MKGRQMKDIVSELLAHLKPLRFSLPVTHVYNPLIYARKGYFQYYEKYGGSPKEIIFLGMNPGPWGMAQTGVPFGDAGMVRNWLDIEADIGSPEKPHPKRPVHGFSCPRGEVSGKRLWGWAKERFGTPDLFFDRFWVSNYCPLVFMEHSGRNRTPDKIRKIESAPLFAACDDALRQTVELMKPAYLIGIGNFAFQRARWALDGTKICIGRISHPSPANPRANAGWGPLIEKELKGQGVVI